MGPSLTRDGWTKLCSHPGVRAPVAPGSSGGLVLVHTHGLPPGGSCPPHLSWPGPSPCQGTYQPRFDWRVHANSSGLFLHGEREWRRTARVGTVGGAGGLCLLTRRGEKGGRRRKRRREGRGRRERQHSARWICRLQTALKPASPAASFQPLATWLLVPPSSLLSPPSLLLSGPPLSSPLSEQNDTSKPHCWGWQVGAMSCAKCTGPVCC